MLERCSYGRNETFRFTCVSKPLSDVLEKQKVKAEHGLSDKEVEKRRETYGLNRLEEEEGESYSVSF